MSVPRSGTRFWLYFLGKVLGIEYVSYAHFGIDEEPEKLIDQFDVIVVPTRREEDVRASWRKPYHHLKQRRWTVYLDDCFKELKRLTPLLEEKGAHFVSTNRHETSIFEFTKLLRALNLSFTDAAVDFYDEWPTICSQHRNEDERDRQALEFGRKNRATLNP